MTFREFYEVYKRDKSSRIRKNTWQKKDYIINNKVMPYLGDLKLSDISKVTIIQWQNKMMSFVDENGRRYSPTYLRNIHAQLSSVLNHACKYYDLQHNVARQVGSMGEKEAKEMEFWTFEEFEKFIEAIKDKPEFYHAFEILYWCGIRMGELFALTKEKFDFKAKTIRIDQSLQRIDGEDLITEPKTKKSIRTILMPDFLAEMMESYLDGFYKLKDDDLIFSISKSSLHKEMDRGSKKTGVKRIRIHDLRHSHVSLLIELGYSAFAIAERVGHESIDITHRYAHLFPTEQVDMANSLNSLRKEHENDWASLLEEDENDKDI